MRRVLGLAVAVLVAMALGRVITETLPVDQVATAPFVREGHVGRAVHLSYADVTATGVRVGRRMYGVDPVKAAGRFLMVDVTLRSTRESTRFAGFAVVDHTGRRFAPTDRGTGCATSTNAPAGVRWYGVYCFDVPRTALAGAHLVVARSDYGVNGSDQRRDDLADIDLRISPTRAARLWAQDVAYEAPQPGLDPIPVTPAKEKSS